MAGYAEASHLDGEVAIADFSVATLERLGQRGGMGLMRQSGSFCPTSERAVIQVRHTKSGAA